MQLHTNKVYRGRIIVTSATFEVLPKHIIPKLEDVGFGDVQVWFYADELPADWPSDRKQDDSGLGETQVFLEGTWKGDDGVNLPEGGEQWKLYDIWEYGQSAGAIEYGHARTSLGQAMYVGAWALGIFLVGLPIVLAATADDKR